eukprot:CAMPEP_0198150328 /NCGR_PEP_ID=MMETSP1443-20131203/50408_1 /TAXON_ID=186043 /ORGANISM="Entomoneis sp., Strain CCMP2396" /LENGTH=136 /DNA_ID=CAMNT_0043815607 /DNA_START=82 /DNA_END=488 /DNA_ORIENTATION=-
MAGSSLDSKKGSRVKIIGGSHNACSGWIDKSRFPSNDYTPVIVVKKKGNREQELQTKVKHENYARNTKIKPAVNYGQAVLQQHADINELLNTLVRKMAQCELSGATDKSNKNFSSIFINRLCKARQRQEVKGSKAL